jgi:hypothetical protein
LTLEPMAPQDAQDAYLARFAELMAAHDRGASV